MITTNFSVEFVSADSDGKPEKAIVSVHCPICGRETKIEMTSDQYDEYKFAADNPQSGKKIQEIFPDWSVERRERACSGYCDEHHSRVFAKPMSDEEANGSAEADDDGPVAPPSEEEYHRQCVEKCRSYEEHELLLLEKACEGNKDGLELQRFVTKCVMDLMAVFHEQGHSGFSASYVANVFDRLVARKPLSPLTGEEDEWSEPVESDTGSIQQNKRYPSVFREGGTNKTAHDVDAISFSDNGGVTFFGAGWLRRKYGDSVKFPYYPPDVSRKVYIRWKNAEQTEFDDITNDEEAKKELRERFYADMAADEAEEKAKKLQESLDKAEKRE